MANVTFHKIGKTYTDGTRAVHDLTLEVEDGELMVFVGPSGCGKSTALRMVAGLEDVTDGDIRIDGEIVNGIEPRERDVAMVFQNYALYPHMNVFANIAFPLRSRGVGKPEIRRRVEAAATLLGLESELKRKPRMLSGGQRQRVAMGRAIVREPRVFLMDEPLSNLDATLRVQMRGELARLQRELGVTMIYVTHDQVEAMTMGTRIAVMRKGELQQLGPPHVVYSRPANLFVASFIGAPPMNLFRARLESDPHGLACVVGMFRIQLSEEFMAAHPDLSRYIGRDLAAGIRAEHLDIRMSPTKAAGGLTCEVQYVEMLGAEQLVHGAIEAEAVLTEAILEIAEDTDTAVAQALQDAAKSHRATIVARSLTEVPIEAGSFVQLGIPVSRLNFFDLETGARID